MDSIGNKLTTYDRGELTVSYKMNRLKFKIAGKLPIILEEFRKYTQFNKGKAKDVNT